jgi:hypothetical protein
VDLKARRITIASPDDRKRLVAEPWSEGEMRGEVNKEKSNLAIEIYPGKSGRPWRFRVPV